MKKTILLSLLTYLSINIKAQNTLQIIVKDSTTIQPLAGVNINSNQLNIKTLTDSNGISIINKIPEGKYEFVFSYIGYKKTIQTFTFSLSDTNSIQTIYLAPINTQLQDVVVISTTRNNSKIENSPLRVEVLGKEELNEENTIKPGNIASILSDVSGVQIQQSSAISGNANVRIQGLDGRYTQILRDGIPLYEGFSGGFGVLQIPPLDLAQIELIKGSASTLYGGGAIGGLINLISKKPTHQQEIVFTLNQTTLQETNLNTYLAKRYTKWGYTFFTGYTHQNDIDINKDGLSDVPNVNSIIIHPKIFIYPSSKTAISIGYSGIWENRNGGDIEVLNGKSDATHQYFEKNITQRNTAKLLIEQSFYHHIKGTIKTSISNFDRTIQSQNPLFKGKQINYFSEISLFIPNAKNDWVAGINMVGDQFKKKSIDIIALNNFSNNTIGAFVQYTAKFSLKTILEAGLRFDHHFTYGNFILPRIALFHRFNQTWSTRLGIGFGYKTPNALSPQTVDYPIEEIQPITNTKAEQSIGTNAELNYKKEWNKNNSLFINQTFFLTHIQSPIIASTAMNKVFFNNADKPIITQGSDTYIKLTLEEWEIYAGYTFTIAERKYLTSHQFIPLTPKHRFAFTIVKENENQWRFGLEGSYNGSQYRDGDTKTPSYFTIAAMIEKKLGNKFSVVLNGENLLDVRQSKYESLYTGTITNPIFKPLWAPIDGRVINLAVRFKI